MTEIEVPRPTGPSRNTHYSDLLQAIGWLEEMELRQSPALEVDEVLKTCARLLAIDGEEELALKLLALLAEIE